MADETYDLEARVSVDSRDAQRSLDRLASEFSSLNEATQHSSGMIDRWEKRMVMAGKNARTFTTSVGQGSKALDQQARSVSNIVAEYAKLSRTQGTNIADMYLRGADEVQIAIQRFKNAEQERIQFARAQTEETKRLEKEKVAAAKAAERERIAAEKAAAAESARIEKQRLADAKASAAARLASARTELAGLVSSANQLSVGKSLARDFFSEFRNSKDIDKQRAYLDMMEQSMEGLANQRYALYDVATTMTAVTVATTGLVIGANAVEAGFDKAFGQVARTNVDLTAEGLVAMRGELEGLTHQLPIAFDEVAKVATIGAQMNISAKALSGFTQTVSMFSATTGTSLDETAMSLGRLAQLTGTSESEISNLASSIYQTGINSVATEQQILEVASQIATAGDLAGFTNTEIIGLSSALASLGVAPEQSRGAIMRVFGDITEAVSTGGAELQAFAATSGMTADEFRAQWGKNSQQVFSGYIQGLSELDSTLLDVTLKQQGFINVRDRNVLSRLANNTEVYATALADAGVAYQENTALAEGYNTATDNLIDNATRLKNILLDLAQSAGNSAIFNGLVKGAIALAELLENIASTPAGQAIMGTVAALTAVVGIATAAVAVYATFYASLLAVTTGLKYAQNAAGGTTLSVRALTVELLRTTATTNGASAALFGLANAETRAAAAGKIATATLRGLALATGVGAALAGAVVLFDALANATKDAAERAKDYYDTVGISTDFSSAIEADTKAYQENGEALRVVTQEAANNTSAQNTAKDAILDATGARVGSADAANQEAAAVKNSTIALGENVKAQAANMLASDERVQKLYREGDAFERLGGNVKDYLNAALAAPGGGEAYLRSLQGFTEIVEDGSEKTAQLAIASNGLIAVNEDLQAVINESAISTQIMNDVMGDAQVQAQGAAIGMEEFGTATDEAGNTIQDAIDKVYGTVDATYAVEDALFSLGESLGENGRSFSQFTEGGRANMQALSETINAMATAAGDDTVAFTSNVAGLMATLQAQGVNTGNELAFVGDILNDLTGRQWGIDFNSAAARKDILSFIETSIKALEVRAQLERQRIATANAANKQAQLSASVFSSSGAPAPMRLMPVPDSSELNQINQSIQAMKGLYSSAQAAASANTAVASGARNVGSSMQDGYGKGAAAAQKAAQATKDAADKTKDMQREVRTLEDYANDLSGVMDRVVELMFGNQNARDNVFEVLAGMKDDIADGEKAISGARAAVRGLRSDLKDARIRVTELNAELRSLKADRNTLQYQLKVAVEYGDDLRAAEIRGELAEKNAEIAKTEKDRSDASREVAQTLKDLRQAQIDVQKAINESSRSLTGNSKTARENRARVQELVKAYKDQITAAAANGASQSQLRALTARLSSEFSQQLRQMGYNRKEVAKYKDAFNEFSSVIKRVPRNVTVKTVAKTYAAQQAINEFIARNRNRSVNVSVNAGRVGDIKGGSLRPSGVKVGGGGITSPNMRTGDIRASRITNNRGVPVPQFALSTGGYASYLASGGVGGMHPGAPKGTDTIPAWLTPGEFVHNNKAVDYYGLPFMNAINNMQFPRYLATGSGGSGGGSMGPSLVELMPRQLMQLAQMVSTQVTIDGKIVASAVNSQNRNSSVRKVN